MKKILLAAAVTLSAFATSFAQEVHRSTEVVRHTTRRHVSNVNANNNNDNRYNNNDNNNRRADRNVSVTRTTSYSDGNGYSHRRYHKRVRRVHHYRPENN